MTKSRVHQGNKLKHLIEKSDFTIQQVSEKTDMPRSTLYDLFKKSDIPRDTLEIFCELLGVNIREFFPDIANASSNPETPYEVLVERVKSLEEMIKAKDVIIISQQEMIELLKKANKK
jgi:transcriptional regulator with XRE-family HTH domain